MWALPALPPPQIPPKSREVKDLPMPLPDRSLNQSGFSSAIAGLGTQSDLRPAALNGIVIFLLITINNEATTS